MIRPALAFASLVLFSTPTTVSAQLTPCGNLEGSEYKVLLDDITDASGSALPLLHTLASRVDFNLEQLRTESGLPLTVVRCAKRRPQDPAEFTRPIVQRYAARRVVLEVWGSTVQETEGGAAEHVAALGYMLMPVRLYEFDAANRLGAVRVERRARSVTSADALAGLVDDAGRMSAYVALSAGAKLLRELEYDRARSQACKAAAILGRATGPGTTAGERALADYARRLARDVVAAARADANYRGVLKALPVAGCG
jgi:hypothetical protein